MADGRRTYWSLYYLAGYLGGGGLGLVVAPAFFLGVFQNNQDFGDTTPRMIGVFLVALAILVVGVIRERVARMIPNPLFPVLMAIVIVGVVLTLVFHALDRRDAASG